MATTSRQRERRFVRSEDPSLSPEANRLLTEELQAVVGTDEVDVAPETAHREREQHATGTPERAALVNTRLVLAVTFFVMLSVGVVWSLATHSWWALVAALGIHAIGTLAVAGAALQIATEVEHVSPDVAARLEDEGVSDPDRVLTDLVEEYAGARGAHGVAEVVSSGHNERATSVDDDRARATVEQESALSPTGAPSTAAQPGRDLSLLPAYAVGAGSALSIVVGAILGGTWWVVPGVVLVVAAGWLALIGSMRSREADATGPGRGPGEVGAGVRRRLLPLAATVVLGVVGFAILVGVVAGLL